MAENINVNNQLALANLTPEEASNNLNDANLLDVNPDDYSSSKEDYKPLLEKAQAPVVARPQVARKIASSSTVASVMKPNVKELNDSEDVLDGLGKLWNRTSKRIDYGSDQRRMNELGSKWLSQGTLSGKEEAEFQILKGRSAKFLRENPDFNADFFSTKYASTLPSTVADVVVDQARGIFGEAPIVAGATGTGAALGGAAGAAVGGAGAIPGAIAGGLSGLSLGVKAAQAIDAYKQTRGSLANDLRLATDEKTGQPLNLPPQVISQVSNGIGAIVAGFDAISFSKVTGGAKWVRQAIRMSPVEVAKKLTGQIATAPADQMKTTLIRKLGTIAAHEGGTEALQEIIQQFGKSLGESWNGNEMQFWNAFSGVADGYYKDIKGFAKTGKLEGNLRGVVESGTIGAAAGPSTTLALGAVTSAVPSVMGKVQEGRQGPNVSTDNKRLEVMPAIEKGQKAIEAKVITDELVKLTGNTELQKLQPGQMSELIQNQAISAGVPHVWVDPQTMKDWAGSDEKRMRVVESLFSGRDTGDAQINAPFQVNTNLVVDIAREYPDFTENIKSDSNGVTFKQWHEMGTEIQKRQQELLQKPGMEKEVRNADDDLLDTVTSKEAAKSLIDAYQSELDKAQEKIKSENRTADKIEQQFIDDQTRIIRKLQNQYTFLPSEAELQGGTQLSFEEQYDRKKGAEARNVTLTPESTDDDIRRQLPTQEAAQAYLNRLDTNLVQELATTEEGQENPKVAQIQAMKERINTLREGLPSETEMLDPNQLVMEKADEVERDNPQLPPDLRAALPQDLVRNFEGGEAAAREFTVDEIREAGANEMLKVTDAMEAAAHEAERDQLEQDYSSNPNIGIVESFIGSARFDKASREALAVNPDLPVKHPAYAIDPRSLTEDQRNAYLENQTLADRKVFHKKGITLREAAESLGVSPDKLLSVLAETPTKDEAIQKTLERRSEQIANEAAFATDLNATSIVKHLENKTAINKRVMDFMRTTKEGWKGLKAGFQAVAFPTPRSEDMRMQASNRINNETLIKDLDINKYRIGERRSRRQSANAFVKGDFQTAFMEKQAETMNVELQRATMLANGEVNRRVKKLARLLGDRNMDRLEAAGKRYVEAHMQIVDLFNLDPRAQGNWAQSDAWVKMADSAVKEGQGDLRIPEGVVNSFDPRMPWNYLTPDQFNYLVDRLDNLSKLAAQKEEYIGEYRDGVIKMNQDMMEAAWDENARSNPSYNEKKAITGEFKEREMTLREKVADKLTTLSSILLSNMQYISLEFDNGKIDGFMQDVVFNRLMGTGKWEGPYGAKQRDVMRSDVRKVWDSEIKAYGKSEFKNMGLQQVEVPEFAGIEGLNYGNLRKSDLFVMAAHMGNDSNFGELLKFGVDRETIMTVMERELDHKDMTFLQNAVWNVNKALEGRVLALEQLDNQDVQMIPPREFTFKGKVYPGGYFHITRENLSPENSKVMRLLGTTTSEFVPNYAARGMTAQGYTEARVENDHKISLSPMTFAFGFEEVINDLAMRVPVRDTFKMLNNDNIRKSVVSVVGQSKYKILIDAIASQTRSDDAHRMYAKIHGEAFLERAISKISGLEAISTLAGNITSVIIQPISILNVMERMGGVNSAKHLATAVGKLAAPWNYQYWPQVYQFAASMDQGIENHRQGLDDHMMSGISDLIPRDTGSKPVNVLRDARDYTNQRLMGLMGAMDVTMKTVSALAAYSQFMSGEAPGHSVESISKMTDAERQTAARQYAGSISGTSLTQGSDLYKSNFQRSILGGLFGRYFNDARNTINSALQSNRDVSNITREAVNLAKAGDYEGAANKFTDSGTKVLELAAITTAALFFESAVRGKLPEEEEAGPEWFAKELLIQRYAQNIPFVRDVQFAIETRRQPSIPLYNFGMNLAYGGIGAAKLANSMIEYGDAAYAMGKLNKQELRGMLSMTSYLLGGVPVNGPWKLTQAAVSEGKKTPQLASEKAAIGSVAMVAAQLQKFIKKHEDEENMGPVVSQMRQQLMALPSDSADHVSNLDMAAIAKAENAGGKWNARNPNTGAFGHFQILPSTWDDIVARAPKELGLTSRGLYQKDGEQAAKGAKWYANEIARQLLKDGINPTLTNIYGGWHFGAAGWSKIVNADPSTAKSKVLSKDVMNANPWTQKATIKTAQDVITWLNRYVQNARLKSLAKN